MHTFILFYVERRRAVLNCSFGTQMEIADIQNSTVLQRSGIMTFFWIASVTLHLPEMF